MFQKKDVIFSDAIGVCYVEDIVKLAARKNAVPVAYYVLRSLTDKKKNSWTAATKTKKSIGGQSL